jgi:hypothetical protein
MVWFFAKGNDSVRIETRFDNTAREFVLEVVWPDRPLATERFSNLDKFQSRVLALEAQLEAEAWAQVGNAAIQPHGWRGPFTN